MEVSSSTIPPSLGVPSGAPLSPEGAGQFAKARKQGDHLFRWVTIGSAVIVPLLIIGLFYSLTDLSWLSIRHFGLKFIFSSAWNPVKQDFGALSSIYGTLVSTAIAMILAVPLSLAIALFLVELVPPAVGRVVGSAIELLAAIPSIIFGMWGLFVFAPFMADHVQPLLAGIAGDLPFFRGPPMGIGMLTGVLLAVARVSGETAPLLFTALNSPFWMKSLSGPTATALSGGQQQRLCIARAIAVEPEILLMDEPTSAIDPIATAKIEDLIVNLKYRFTIVIVTHNMQQAARISDFTAFFYRGVIVEYGETEKIFTKPENKQTEEYITGRFG